MSQNKENQNVSLTKYQLASKVDPRVYEIFERKVEGCDQEKLDKVLARVDTLNQQGKSLQRAMADALSEFKLT